MNITALTWFVTGACIIYVLAVDANVLEFLMLLAKSAGVWCQRQWFRVRYHPDSPWVRYAINRNAERLAKELQKHYQNPND